MSTFNGIVSEFPDIRIDYFRIDTRRPPPLRFFLSHVHSDHLQGLESCRSPFLHCSPATREILLRLEKFPHRMNFAKGILESRRQTYKHLAKILKPIPLETPTEIELAPGNTVRVTLFDANHCVGAVMFLIEGGGNAILYTGDIRSELWWVNSLCRHPVLLPYVSHGGKKPLKKIDNVYLDTTFATKHNKYRHFPTKAEGVTELLHKVSQHPPGTQFYFDTWTFGYEDVWQALSTFLGSQIHVDEYRYGLYSSLDKIQEATPGEAYKLIRSRCGNHIQEGCLSNEDQRIHSCEKGTGCDIWERNFIRITPVISRYNGQELTEKGAGGGQGDLNQQHEIQLDDVQGISELMGAIVQRLSGQLLHGVVDMVKQATSGGRKAISLELAEIVAEGYSHAASQDEADLADLDQLPIGRLVMLLAKRVTKKKHSTPATQSNTAGNPFGADLPRQITFPYSRHSSYVELCMLIEAFRPKDIYPCTVDEDGWDETSSMGHLFGHFYDSPLLFTHDQMMRRKRNEEGSSHSLLDDSQSQPRQGSTVQPTAVLRSRSPVKRKNQGDGEVDESKRRRGSTQGEFWPPGEKDHYSPEYTERPSSRSARAGSYISRASAEGRRVFIRNIFYETTTNDLERFFQDYSVEETHLPFNNRWRIGYAFVTFTSAATARRAVAELQGSNLVGRRASLELTRADGTQHSEVVEEPLLPEKAWSQHSQLLEQPLSPNQHRNMGQQRTATARDKIPENKPRHSADRSSVDRRPASSSGRIASDVKAACTRDWLGNGIGKLRPQPEGYGRLSPPPVSTTTEKEELIELTPDELKEALQRHAYSAVLNGGADWSLVSIDGHQIKEEEL